MAAAVIVVTVLAAVLRLPALDSGFWFDEILTVVQSMRPPLVQLATTFSGDYGPLYGLLAKGTVALFGEHPWSVRLPAVLFGVATVPVLYLLGTAVATRTEALLAALLLAVSYHHVWFSQNARGYTLLLFVTVVSTLLFVSLVQRPRRAPAAAYAVAMGLGLYTHLTMAFVLVAHACAWTATIVRERPGPQRSALVRSAILAVAGAAVVGGLLYLPMAAQMRATFGTTRHQRHAGVATPGWAFLELVRGLRIGFGTMGPLLVGVLAATGAISYVRRNRTALFLFVLPGVMTAAALMLVGSAIRPRFFVAFLGFALILIVRGATECSRLAMRNSSERAARFGGTIIVGVIAAVSVVSLGHNYRYPKQDFEGALRYVERNRAPDEPVRTAGAAMFPYESYYRTPWTPLEEPAPLESLLAHPGRVWFVYSFPEYLDPQLETFLAEQCADRRVFPGTVGGGDVVVCTTGGRGTAK